MKNVLDDLSEQFSGRVWGANGPLVVTRAMTGLCDGQVWVGQDDIMQCEDVTVFRQGTNQMRGTLLTNFLLFIYVSLLKETLNKYSGLASLGLRKVWSSINQQNLVCSISETLLSH